MIQSSSPIHTAIIMDGNGRWAQNRGLPRCLGHRRGAQALRRVVEAAPAFGVRLLTLYAFSADNWNRPRDEVESLMALLADQLREQARTCQSQGVRMEMIGRRDRLPVSVVQAAAFAEDLTSSGTRLHLRLAIDYSARASIRGSAVGEDVDLLIRTGGEQRLSDFLLWECAYAELFFTPCLWPDFGPEELSAAVHTFRARHRRFGSIAPESQIPDSTLGELEAPDAPAFICQLRRDRWLR